MLIKKWSTKLQHNKTISKECRIRQLISFLFNSPKTVCNPRAKANLRFSPRFAYIYYQPAALSYQADWIQENTGTSQDEERTQGHGILFILRTRNEHWLYGKINSTNVHYQLSAGIYNVCMNATHTDTAQAHTLRSTNTQAVTPIRTERLWGTVLSPTPEKIKPNRPS